MVQAFPYASPIKWHLAHTTWFFETFVAEALGAKPEREDWGRYFNSYYEGLGRPYPQSKRGLLSRPALSEVLAYRRRVDDAVLEGLEQMGQRSLAPELETLLLTGIAHEEQHQELILTDALANFSLHPQAPALFSGELPKAQAPSQEPWLAFDHRIVRLGADGTRFCFDNEMPVHECIVYPFELSRTLVTNAQMQEFISDRGYQRPELWLSRGMEWVRQSGAQHPRYWRKGASGWMQWSLYGEQPLDPHAPVVHINGYEAEALATYLGARLPTEAEWELAANAGPGPEQARWLGEGMVMPTQPRAGVYGEVWNWTRSSYLPYPGFEPRAGAVGEYNGKFMSDAWVLRGGSCATPPGHLRASYRNFFHPAHTWQFSGLRLARDR